MRTQLLDRLTAYSASVIELYSSLPRSTVAQTVGKQLLRSAISAGAHYSEAQHAKSKLDFISKVEGGTQELEESLYWINLLTTTSIGPPEQLTPLSVETDELIRILYTIARNAKRRL
jgi:four helix bundle protein